MKSSSPSFSDWRNQMSWNDVSSPRKKNELKHGATFPEKLVSRLILLYSPNIDDIILDPFLGTGTTLEACKNLKRNGIGIELNEEFAEYAQKRISQLSFGHFLKDETKKKQKLILLKGDCREKLQGIDAETIQLTITSPPYANFIHKSILDRKTVHKKSLIQNQNNSTIKPYSNNPKDFGNMEYPQFLKETQLVFKQLYRVTKPKGYAIWIIKDYRDTKQGIPYVAFHEDLITCAKHAGFFLRDLIIWDQNEQRNLVLLGYPSVFYSNQNNSFIVVLKK